MKKNVIMKASAFFMSAIALTIGFASCNSNNNEGKEGGTTVDPESSVELVLSESSVSVNEGLTVTVEITQGNGGYTVKSANEEVAVAEVSGTTVSIKGVKAGSTTITVVDKAPKAKAISVQVVSAADNNINTDALYTITVFDNEEGYTNWWHPTLTKEAKNTLILTKRDWNNNKLSKSSFGDCCGDYFALVDDDNVFVCGGYLGEGTKPDYGYAAPALLLTNEDDPAHPGCKKVTVLTTNLAAALDWAGYTSTPGTAYYDPTDGSFTLENCKGFLCWNGNGNEDWIFTLNRKYTPQK